MTKRRAVSAVIAAATATVVAVVPGTASATPETAHSSRFTTAASSDNTFPTSTSWISATTGIVLAYPQLSPGASPTLALTNDGGKTWRSLHAPSVTFPADRDFPQIAFDGQVIAVTNGGQLQTSHDEGRHWTAVRLPTSSGPRPGISDIGVYRSRVLAVLTTVRQTSETDQVYTDTHSSSLSAVGGLSLTGDVVSGQIDTDAGVQVALSAPSSAVKYWYSRTGSTFTSAPAPCSKDDLPFLAGVEEGKPVALCTSGVSSVQPGTTTARMTVAPRLGATFVPLHAAVQLPNPEDIAAVSTTAVIVGSEPGLGATFDGGQSYADEVATPEGSTWTSIAVPSRTVGVAVGATIDKSGEFVSNVYRSTDAGQHWVALHL